MRISITPVLDLCSHPIQRAADTGWPAMKDVRIDHCRFDIAMPQPLLNRAIEDVMGPC